MSALFVDKKSESIVYMGWIFDISLCESSTNQSIIYVCRYNHTYINSKSMDQPGKVANHARGQLNRENEYFPVGVRA